MAIFIDVLDGGASSTSTWQDAFDGGNSTTSSWTESIDGGLSPNFFIQLPSEGILIGGAGQLLFLVGSGGFIVGGGASTTVISGSGAPVYDGGNSTTTIWAIDLDGGLAGTVSWEDDISGGDAPFSQSALIVGSGGFIVGGIPPLFIQIVHPTPTAGLLLGGTVQKNSVVLLTPIAGTVFNGSAVFGQRSILQAVGGGIFGGSADISINETQTTSIVGSGGIEFGGVVSSSYRSVNPTVSGGIVFAGAATVFLPIVGSSGFIVAGNATFAYIKIFTQTTDGGVIANGTPLFIAAKSVQPLPTAGFVSGGTASANCVVNHIPISGTVLNGSTIHLRIVSLLGSDGVVYDGTAEWQQITGDLTGTGGIVIEGSADTGTNNTISAEIIGAGGCVFGGSSSVTQLINFIADSIDGALFGGSATTAINSVSISSITGDGGPVFDGSAIIVVPGVTVGDGGILISGTSDFILCKILTGSLGCVIGGISSFSFRESYLGQGGLLFGGLAQTQVVGAFQVPVPTNRTIIIVAENRTVIIGDNVAVTFSAPFDPDEQEDFRVDWSPQMASVGDEISTSTLTLSATALAAGLEIYQKFTDNQNHLITFWLRSNDKVATRVLSGTRINIDHTVTTTAGRVYNRTLKLRIKEK